MPTTKRTAKGTKNTTTRASTKATRGMTTLDRAALRVLQADALAALAAVAEKHGVTFGVKRGTFAHTWAELTFSVALRDASGQPTSREGDAFKLYAPLDGVPADALGRDIIVNRETYTLVGYNARSRRAPYLMRKASTGATFRAPRATVQKALGVPVTTF